MTSSSRRSDRARAPLPASFFASLGVIPAYVVGWFLWLASQWAAILPPTLAPGNLESMMLPPLVLPAVYLCWLASRRLRKAHPSRARLMQFAIASGAGVVAAAFFTLLGADTGRVLTFLAMIAGALMVAVALVTLFVDRDVELSVRIVLLTLLAIVPVVVAGRLLAIGGMAVVYAVFRASHGKLP